MRSGFVYIMVRPDGIRKLGCTVNLRQRLGTLSSMSGVRHTFERTWEMGDHAAFCVESRVHYQLRDVRYRGESSIELYQLPLARLVRAVKEATRHVAQTLPNGLMSCWPLPALAPDWKPPAMPPTRWQTDMAEFEKYAAEHPEELEALIAAWDAIGRQAEGASA